MWPGEERYPKEVGPTVGNAPQERMTFLPGPLNITTCQLIGVCTHGTAKSTVGIGGDCTGMDGDHSDFHSC
jgi:hypothetical protein